MFSKKLGMVSALALFLSVISGSSGMTGFAASVPLSTTQSVHLLQGALQNQTSTQYTQDVKDQKTVGMTSPPSNVSNSSITTVYVQNGLQYIPKAHFYQTTKYMWFFLNSTWRIDRQLFVNPHPSKIMLSLNASSIERCFREFKVEQNDSHDITYVLVPRIPYETDVFNEVKEDLLPGTPSEPESSVWDLSIQLHLHYDGKYWWITNDRFSYALTNIEFVDGSDIVYVTKSSDVYSHDPIPVVLPKDAPRNPGT